MAANHVVLVNIADVRRRKDNMDTFMGRIYEKLYNLPNHITIGFILVFLTIFWSFAIIHMISFVHHWHTLGISTYMPFNLDKIIK